MRMINLSLVLGVILVLARPYCVLAGAPQRILLAEADASELPGLELVTQDETSCRIDFRLPYLQMEEVVAEGKTYQALTIPGGGMAGEIGQPGLPTFSGLVAIPEGKSVQCELISHNKRTLSGYRVLPVAGYAPW